jgi:hypothetical protein
MSYLYVGGRGKIAVIDASTGKTIKLITLDPKLIKSGDGFVNMLKKGDLIYEHTFGQLYCVDISSGKTLWSNELTGLGYDLASIISDDDNNIKMNAAAEKMKHISNQRRSGD